MATIIPVDSIEIPCEYLELCNSWYDGMDDMLYAIASTGRLTIGSIRPRGADTDEKWYLSIWHNLSCDVCYARRSAEKSGHEDHDALNEFEDWVDAQVDMLATSYGLEDWDGYDE
jgi:hypothetical protein